MTEISIAVGECVYTPGAKSDLAAQTRRDHSPGLNTDIIYIGSCFADLRSLVQGFLV